MDVSSVKDALYYATKAIVGYYNESVEFAIDSVESVKEAFVNIKSMYLEMTTAVDGVLDCFPDIVSSFLLMSITLGFALFIIHLIGGVVK